MKLNASFCNPIYPDPIDLGDISRESVIGHFEKIDWNGYLQQSENAKMDDIYYHPTFEIENKENKTKLGISAVGMPNKYTFNIIYTRQKREKVKSVFGSKEKITDDYVTVIHEQAREDAIECLQAFIGNDTNYLSAKIGQ